MTHSSFTHFAPFFYSSTAEQRRPESIFKTQTPLLFQNFWIRVRQVFKFKNPTPVQTQATIIDQTAIYPWFYLRIDRTDSCYCRKSGKSDSDSGSGFPQIFDSGSGSGSERKKQNPAGVDSGNPDPVPLLQQRWQESLFQTLTPLLFQKFLNPGPDPAILLIWESVSFADSGYNHRFNRNLPMF